MERERSAVEVGGEAATENAGERSFAVRQRLELFTFFCHGRWRPAVCGCWPMKRDDKDLISVEPPLSQQRDTAALQ